MQLHTLRGKVCNMKIGSLFAFLTCLFFGLGIRHIAHYCMLVYSYKNLKEGNETFSDFCKRRLDSASWRFREHLPFKWFYDSKCFIFFQILWGVLLVLVGVCLLALYFLIQNSEYGIFLEERF